MSFADWIDIQASCGRYTFYREDVMHVFPDMTSHSLDIAMQRATGKGRLFSPCRGFYVIVPEEYRLWKAVPQDVYLDRMMQYLDRRYYVSLLSAAERHGAAHQAPMCCQVMVEPPVLRDKIRDGYTIRYAERRVIPMDYVQRLQVPSGWLNISNPELTAIDLVAYHDHVGGLTRAATVLEELVMKLDFGHLDTDFTKVAAVPVFQRLGYLLDKVLQESAVADGLMELIKRAGLKFKAVPLKTGATTDGSPVCERWKVAVNQVIETDDL